MSWAGDVRWAGSVCQDLVMSDKHTKNHLCYYWKTINPVSQHPS